MRQSNRFLHSGDIGDIIAAMPIIRQLGGGTIVITHPRYIPHRMPRQSMKGARFRALLPLLLHEDYIDGVEWQDVPDGITHNLRDFRMMDWNKTDNLSQWQARYLGIADLDMSPWLMIPVGSNSKHVIVSRTLRYHNPSFPWTKIGDVYKENLVFMGHEDEATAFRKMMGRDIPRVHTDNFLSVAYVIALSKRFIGNQSAPFWVAAGLGKDLVQEVWQPEPNSIVLRSNANYTGIGI